MSEYSDNSCEVPEDFDQWHPDQQKAWKSATVSDSSEGHSRLAVLWQRPMIDIAKDLLLSAASAPRAQDAEGAIFIAHGLIGAAKRIAEEWDSFIDQARSAQIELDRVTQGLLFDIEQAKEKVYFQTDGEFIKIGTTERSEAKRRKENQTGNPRKLTTLAVIPGASEKLVQSRFGSSRVRGEWFRKTPELMAFIQAWQMVKVAFR